MEFSRVVKERYAAKSFNGNLVPLEQVEELMDMILCAPTSVNLQPWQALVIRDDQRKQALLEHSWNQPSITSCSHLFVFCANTDFTALLDRLETRMTDAGIPQENVDAYMGMSRGFIETLSDKIAWAQRQTFIALAHGLLAAKSLGIDSCPMEGFIPEQYTKILGLPDHLVPTVLMPIGYANDTPHPKLRFSRDEMFLDSV